MLQEKLSGAFKYRQNHLADPGGKGGLTPHNKILRTPQCGDVFSGNASQIYLAFYTHSMVYGREMSIRLCYMWDYYMHDSFMFRRHSLLSGKQYAWLTLCITYRCVQERAAAARLLKQKYKKCSTFTVDLRPLPALVTRSNSERNNRFNNCIACFALSYEISSQRLQL